MRRYRRYVEKFDRMFSDTRGKKLPRYYIPGNHDVWFVTSSLLRLDVMNETYHLTGSEEMIRSASWRERAIRPTLDRSTLTHL